MTARKFLTLLLALALLLGALSGCAKQNRAAAAPIVFVHGYSGWGEYDEKNDRIPYWGQASVNVKNDLERQGYRACMASVGPLSSAWDRACELYAQLTGTRTDYGAAHSAACGHERYGTDYTGRALIPDFTWDEKHPIHLVGHSFGGVTIRLLLDLLLDGSAAELAAGDAPSPLFAGGHTLWVRSLTIIAAPSNGTTAVYTGDNSSDGAIGGGEPAGSNPALARPGDSALNDMGVDRACAMNAALELQPEVWYFCFYGEKSPDEVSASFRGLASFMASYTGQTPGSYTAAGETVFVPSQTLDASWQPNDCMVNAVSAYCPYHLDAAGNRVYDAHRDVTGGEALNPGEWNIFPEYDWSHIDFLGGVSGSVPADDVRAFYRALAERLTALKA